MIRPIPLYFQTLALFLSLFSGIAFGQKTHTFAIAGGQFLYDGKPTQIHAGEMHYARVPQPYWRHRLKMLKAMGLNTVATYVFWNFHNPAPGVWDFKRDNHNLTEFVKTAQEEGLYVVLRPGPYACAEWEFGGYPWWLQKNKDLVIRTNNKPFLDSCRVYIGKLAEQVTSLQVSQGGPIIMVQAENEFGSYVAQRKDIPLDEHQQYNRAIKQMLTEAGFTVPFFTSDGSNLFEGGSLPGVLPTANGEGNIDNLKKAVDAHHNGKGPYMVAEFYPGWLDHWAEPFTRIGPESIAKQTEVYLKNGVSFNLYMAHGGTNFGFTAGANYNDDHDIQPDITSYDYDAPVSEAGWATPKYTAIRELLKKYAAYAIPEVPARLPVITLPPIALMKTVDLTDFKKSIKPVINDKPLSFEDLNQGHGYVLYSRRFTQPTQGTLKLEGLRDFATVYVNGKKVGELNRIEKQYELPIDIPFNSTLEILVENMGRINYGANINQNTKGIISPVIINDQEITGDWQMIRLPFSEVPDLSKVTAKPAKAGRPTLYSGTFEVKQPGDVFLNMSDWGKGIVFINGHNLGRFWNVGPQQTLYVPGCWLKPGQNNILIFDQLNPTVLSAVKTVDAPILDVLKES
ncbi:glycoside hydrolase family 35 protein [Spirosoma lituiforme]